MTSQPKRQLDKRQERLANLKCPIHGTKMRVEKADALPPSHYEFDFRCTNVGCEVSGGAPSEGGPIELLPQFADLLTEVEAPLPIQTFSQRRGLQAADIASLALTKIAFVHRVETGTDIGIDFICEIRKEDKPTGLLFNVQCKALPSSFDVDDEFASYEIKVSTARYWVEQTHPVILLVPDPDTGMIYWSCPADALANRTDDWRQQGKVTIKVAKTSGFSCFADVPSDLLKATCQGLRHVGKAFQERLYATRKAIDKARVEGVRRDAEGVSTLLADANWLIGEASEAARSLIELQTQLSESIIPIIGELSGAMAHFAQDVYRTAHAVFRNPEPWEESKEFLEARGIIDTASVLVSSIQLPTDYDRLGRLLESLHALDALHQSLLEMERWNEDEQLCRELRQDEIHRANTLSA